MTTCLYHPSIAGGPAAATKCVGGLPGQPAAGCNLYLFDRCLRSRGLVDCGKSGCRKSSQGAAVAELLPTTLSRLPPSSSALRIQLKSISARDPNGHARYGTPWCRRLRLSHSCNLSSVKVESTGVRSGFVHTG